MKRIEISKSNMLATGDLSKTISLRPSKPDCMVELSLGRLNIINSLISVIVRGSGEAKSSDGEKNMEPIDFICLFLCRNHWKKL